MFLFVCFLLLGRYCCCSFYICDDDDDDDDNDDGDDDDNDDDALVVRGTQRIVSVYYLFVKPLIPSDFLKRIVTSNFRGMRNLMSVVFGLLKMSFRVPKEGQLSFKT